MLDRIALEDFVFGHWEMVAGAGRFVTTNFLENLGDHVDVGAQILLLSRSSRPRDCLTTGCATAFCRFVAPTLLPADYAT